MYSRSSLESTLPVAPKYPPATSFEQPIVLPYPLRVGTLSVAELMANSAAWEIVVKYLPQLKLMVSSVMIKPHLGNMSVRGLMSFVSDPPPETLKSIDSELSQLPQPTPGVA